MSNAYKCDRCGKYGDGKPTAFFKFPNPFEQGLTNSDQRKIRLCGDCQDSLTEFIDGVGLSRETDCRTEQIDRLRYGPPKHPINGRCSLFVGDREFSVSEVSFELSRDTDTVLKKQVEMGARNY